MTDELQDAAIAKAEEPALLSGWKARLFMFLATWGLAIIPIAMMLPEKITAFSWRQFWLSSALAAIPPLIGLMVPKKEQELFRAALLESEERRRRLAAELEQERRLYRPPPP